MRLFGFGRKQNATLPAVPAFAANDGGVVISSPAELEQYLRFGVETASGARVTALSALRNSAVFRAVNLTANSMAMLPLNVVERAGQDVRRNRPDHPLALALAKPNGWQSGFDFRRQLQVWLLIYGNAYAVPVRSRGQVIGFLPIDPRRVDVEQNDDLTVEYRVTRKAGAQRIYRQGEILHLRDISLDAVEGLSRVDLAREAIGLSSKLEEAAARLFRQGVLSGRYVKFAQKLSKEKRAEIRADIEEHYSGAENAGKWMITDDGGDVSSMGDTAADSQHLEERSHQVEEIARFFDIPRPLLMVDETAWGSGIEQLATLFVHGALAPWFKCWEEALALICLSDDERRTLSLDFDETELLRGAMKDQAEFFSKARGSGGAGGWLTANDVRRSTGFPPVDGGDALPIQQAQKTTNQKGDGNVSP